MSATTLPFVVTTTTTTPAPSAATASTAPSNIPPIQAPIPDVQTALNTGMITAPAAPAGTPPADASALARRASSRLAVPAKEDAAPEPASGSPSKRKASTVRKNATVPAAPPTPDPAVTRLESDMSTMQASFADVSAGLASNTADIREVAGTMRHLEQSIANADKNIETLTNAINLDLGTVLDNMTASMEEDRKTLGNAVARIEELASKLTGAGVNPPITVGAKRPRGEEDVGPVRPAPVSFHATATYAAPAQGGPAPAALSAYAAPSPAAAPPMVPAMPHAAPQQIPPLPAHLATTHAPTMAPAPSTWAPSTYSPYSSTGHSAPRRGPSMARFVYAQFGPVSWVGPDYLEELRQLVAQHVTHGTGFTGLVKAANLNTNDPRFLIATFNTVKQARDVVNAWNQDTAGGQWGSVHGTIMPGN